MTTARMTSGPVYLKMIEEIDKELKSIIEDFDFAVWALHLVNWTSKLSFLISHFVDSQSLGACCRVTRERAIRPSTDRPRA